MRKYLYYLITGFFVLLGILNVTEKATHKIVWDGILWDETKSGLICKENSKNLFLPEIKEGDILVEAEGVLIKNQDDLYEILSKKKKGESIVYYLMRGGNYFYSSAKLTVKETPLLYYYLVLIGFSGIIISLFIVVQKSESIEVSDALFYSLGLSFYSIYVFSPTFKFDFIDKMFFLLDKAGFLFFPILLIKFFMDFPTKLSEKASKVINYFFIVSSIVLAFYLVLVFEIFKPLYEIGSRVEKIFSVFSLSYFSVGFLVGIVILIYKIYTVEDFYMKNQIKWILGGISAGFIPFFLFYIIPFSSSPSPPEWAQFTVMFQFIIPLSFAYAISGYKLMDFEVLSKKFVVYTTGFFFILTLYLTLLKLFTPGFQGKFTIVAISMIVGYLALGPFFGILEGFANKFFYRRSYFYRQNLIDFSHIVTYRRDLDEIAENFLSIFISALLLKNASIYLFEDSTGSFYLLHSKGDNQNLYPRRISLSDTFLDRLRYTTFIWFYDFRYIKRKAITEEDIKILKSINAYHVIPLKFEDKLRGIIFADRKVNGMYLTSEDWSLLLAILPSVTLALENANLYKSLKNKIDEINSLREFSESIIESVNIGIMVVDENGRIRHWNSFLEKIFSIKKKSVIGKRIDEVLGKSLYIKLKDTNPEQFSRIMVKDSYGKRRTLEITKYSFKREKGFSIFILNDITEKLRIERELITKEKLASVGFLTAGIAHEINTPLTGIKSYCQFLKKSIKDKEDLTLVEEIEKQADRMKILISSLLNFSREGKGVKTEFDVREVIEESISIIDYYVKKKRISLSIDGSNVFVFGDRERLSQVFLNIIKNSIDASKEEGKIDIKISHENGFGKVEIIDYGEGISKEDLPYIFDPFFTTKGIGKGTGLGLSIVYSIVKEHGGDVEVYSKKGVGTKFVVKLPVKT